MVEAFHPGHPYVYDNGSILWEHYMCEVICFQDVNIMLLYYALMMVVVFLGLKGLGAERYLYKRYGQRVDLSWPFGAAIIAYLVSMMFLSSVVVYP